MIAPQDDRCSEDFIAFVISPVFDVNPVLNGIQWKLGIWHAGV